MSDLKTYALELDHFIYNVRSDFNEEKVQKIFERLKKELQDVSENEILATQRDILLLVALNLAQQVIDLEEQNLFFSDVLDRE